MVRQAALVRLGNNAAATEALLIYVLSKNTGCSEWLRKGFMAGASKT
jgi:hypothetical protein